MATLVSRIGDLASAVATALKDQRGISAFCSGKPAASEVIGGAVAPYSFTLAVGRCVAIAKTAATASTTFTITVGGTQIGTIVFSAGATAGVISFTSTAIVAGNVVRLTAPATPDTTLSDISVLLRP